MVKERVIRKKDKEYVVKYDDFNEHYFLHYSVCIGGDGYAVLYKDGKCYRLHRLFVLGFENYFSDKNKKLIIDHIDRNILNNTMVNLRIATKQQNSFNEKIYRNNNKSGYKGVSYDSANHKWAASIMIFGKQIKIGRYINLDEAIIARLKAELLFCGKEFAPQRHLFDKYNIVNYQGLPQRVIERCKI